MKVVCVKKFVDSTNGKLRTVGEEFTVNKKRYEVLKKHKVVEVKEG